MKHIIVQSDGGCRANPGPAGAGCVAYQINEQGQRECIYEKAVFIDKASNNAAEYKGLDLALTYILKQEPEQAEIFCDSKLIVEQTNKVWQVKAPDLIPLHEECCKKVDKIKEKGIKLIIKWVPREMNQHADSLANLALDRKTGCEYRHNVNLDLQMKRCLEAMIAHENIVIEVMKYPKQMKNCRNKLGGTWEEVVSAWAALEVIF